MHRDIAEEPEEVARGADHRSWLENVRYGIMARLGPGTCSTATR